MGGGLTTVNGNLTLVSAGAKEFRLGAGTSPTLNIAGNWIILSGTNVTSTGSGSPIVNLAGDLIVNGTLSLGSGLDATTLANAGGNVSVGARWLRPSTAVDVNFTKPAHAKLCRPTASTARSTGQ